MRRYCYGNSCRLEQTKKQNLIRGWQGGVSEIKACLLRETLKRSTPRPEELSGASFREQKWALQTNFPVVYRIPRLSADVNFLPMSQGVGGYMARDNTKFRSTRLFTYFPPPTSKKTTSHQ